MIDKKLTDGLKVLLIVESPINKSYYLNKNPSLGVLYIASFLESKGISTDVVDCNIEKLGDNSIKDYDAVGFSLNSANTQNSLKTAERIKKVKPNIKILFGGSNVHTNPLFFIKKDFVDAVVIGEGEYTFYEYLTNENPKNVKGLYIKENGNVIFTGERPFIENLDSLPFPAFDKVDLRKFYTPTKIRKPISSIVTSRGCPFECIFCFHPFGKSWRARSPENVVDEMEWQVKEFGVKEILLQDDNISLDIERAKRIFDLVIKRKIKVKFQLCNGIRADRVDKELLKKMKDAGLWYFAVAPEVGSDESLKKINKGFTLDKVNQAIRWAKELNLFTAAFFMIGFPFETKQDIETTIEYAKKLDADLTQFSRVTIFEGTQLYNMLNIKENPEKDKCLYSHIPTFTKVSEKELNRLIKKAYHSCYYKPRVALKLLKTLSLKDLYTLVRYSYVTESA